jgi:Mg-chelatase subunit ChlD
MNSSSPNNPREELEARLTALLLGELSSEEAAALYRKLERDSELSKIYARLKATIELVGVTTADSASETAEPPVALRLSDGRRQKLFAHFKTVAPKEFAESGVRRRSWMLMVGAAAAIVLFLGFLAWSNFTRSASSLEQNVSLGSVRLLGGAGQEWALNNKKSPAGGYSVNGPAQVPPLAASDGDSSGRVATGKRIEIALPASAEKPSLMEREGDIGGTRMLDRMGGDVNAGAPLPSIQPQAASEPALNSAVNEGVYRQANTIALHQKLAEARQARERGELAASAKIYDSASQLAKKIGPGVELEAQQAIAGLARVQSGTAAQGTDGAKTLVPLKIELPAPAFKGAPINLAFDSYSLTTNSLDLNGAVGGFGGGGGLDKPSPSDSESVSFGATVVTNAFISRYAFITPPSSSPSGTVQSTLAKIDGFSQRIVLPADVTSKEELKQLKDSTLGYDVRNGGTLSLSPVPPTTPVPAAPAVSPPDQLTRNAGDVAIVAGNPMPVLGDVPVAGRLFRGLPQESSKESQSASYGAETLRDLDTYALSTNILPSITSEQNRAYSEAKRTLEEAQRFRQLLSMKAASERIDKTLPKTPMVEVVDHADLPVRKPAASAPVPQPEVQSQDNPSSTFSLNVSDVSFKLAGASLEKGLMPEPNTVRTEEFLNAFDYRDPEAPAGVPIAFAWDRARYPFAQNRDVLRFSLKTAAQGRQPGRPLNLVLLLDNSGSMERADRVQIIHEALRVLAAQLQPQDKFSVVTFARTPRLLVDGVAGSEAGRVAEEVSGLTPQGGTNLEEAMKLAYETALRHYLANGVNRVVLLTDGAANLGNVEPEALKQSVESHRQQGIALDCFGIGWDGYNDDLLEVLSRHGDGRYGFVNTPEEAANEFAGQLAGALHVAASDVKVQVEFNPRRVTAYRQLGYAKHQLTKEQFRDNTVDAAEIAAAEAGNALYVVEVNPAGDGPLATVRVRYKVPGTTDYHEHEWSVPYAGNAVSLEAANPAMRLAATASAFAEWLVASPFAQEVTPDRLLGYLKGVPESCGADPRPKKLEWMIRQAKSLAGK